MYDIFALICITYSTTAPPTDHSLIFFSLKKSSFLQMPFVQTALIYGHFFFFNAFLKFLRTFDIPGTSSYEQIRIGFFKGQFK